MMKILTRWVSTSLTWWAFEGLWLELLQVQILNVDIVEAWGGLLADRGVGSIKSCNFGSQCV